MTTQELPFVPELLSPAGSLKNMRYAFAYSADAVTRAGPDYGLRVRNNAGSTTKTYKSVSMKLVLKAKKLYICM